MDATLAIDLTGGLSNRHEVRGSSADYSKAASFESSCLYLSESLCLSKTACGATYGGRLLRAGEDGPKRIAPCRCCEFLTETTELIEIDGARQRHLLAKEEMRASIRYKNGDQPKSCIRKFAI